MTITTRRSRAVSSSGNEVGKLRHGLYKKAIEQINLAAASGFYLEAITLTESLITDRLESHLSYIKGEDFSFKNLGPIIQEMRRLENDEDLLVMVSERLDSWRKERNKSVHEMVKISSSCSDAEWGSRVSRLPHIYVAGINLFRDIDRRCTKLRRQREKSKHQGEIGES